MMNGFFYKLTRSGDFGFPIGEKIFTKGGDKVSDDGCPAIFDIQESTDFAILIPFTYLFSGH
jgi:hypothetical protein